MILKEGFLKHPKPNCFTHFMNAAAIQTQTHVLGEPLLFAATVFQGTVERLKGKSVSVHDLERASPPVSVISSFFEQRDFDLGFCFITAH